MVELLAPAGNFECLMAAIKAGCDSIYFGIDHLNMRASGANNFKAKDIKKISDICHKNNIKAYLTLNIIIFDHELKLVEKLLKKAKQTNIDAVIASDFLVINKAKELGIKIHVSTQASISNYESLKFFSKYADRMVLARELTLPQIKYIKKQIVKDNLRGPSGNLIQIEAFCHGAMCISVSGRCFMSLFEFNASANRGICRQSCRRSYKVIDKETGHEMEIDNDYVMSPEDLCTIKFVDKIIDVGIDCLKIEGRARAVDYVFTCVNCYREAIEAIDKGIYPTSLKNKLYNELKKVYNRGFSNGFYFGVPLESWSKSYGSKASVNKVLIGKVLNYYKKINVAEVLVESNEIKVGDNIGFSGPTTGFFRQKLSQIQIDNRFVDKVLKGKRAAIKSDELVRRNDKVYLFKKNNPKKHNHLINSINIYKI